MSKKRRKSAVSLELDEDDYALVEENTGVAMQRDSNDGSKGFRRLSKKQKQRVEVGVEVGAAGGVESAQKELGQKLFGEEGEEEGEEEAEVTGPWEPVPGPAPPHGVARDGPREG